MILQIIGYKNAGKTTLMSHTIALLKKQQLTVATLKHHGHETEDITLQDDQVDHMKHFQAGADQSIVQGQAYQQTVTRTRKQTITEIIDKSVTIDFDVLLIEGFKHADYAKVIVYQNEAELAQLKQCTHVVYAINLEDEDALAQYDAWMMQQVKGMK
ncbi:molybdopterin-guanine dinucleotide biosynthesis adapter protein [Staphylococcus auricularis]|uniref:molybdopterin-guanine dinucleotide biosynthesis protein B n=1 Tax=Staphylococcus auricularis TaxID=29379 RepID=UPI001931B73D|nr:molybdopterin-guanine dinucleotide biosynthesis protein B [Staphylococcus auricularis]MBM0867312.1 molybdopterin-guanine dinucleotide biosynthesis protein B [Staphylococcus auricularis]